MTGTIDSFQAKAVSPNSVSPDGPLTLPRTWGVYDIEPSDREHSTRRYRFGNHPVRQHELEREFGKVVLVALFLERTLATKLASALNEDLGHAPMS